MSGFMKIFVLPICTVRFVPQPLGPSFASPALSSRFVHTSPRGTVSAISFGSTYKIDVALRDAIRGRQIPGPRLLAAGRDLGATESNVDAAGGLRRIADGPWELRKAVREQRQDRVEVEEPRDCGKLSSSLSSRALQREVWQPTSPSAEAVAPRDSLRAGPKTPYNTHSIALKR